MGAGEIPASFIVLCRKVTEESRQIGDFTVKIIRNLVKRLEGKRITIESNSLGELEYIYKEMKKKGWEVARPVYVGGFFPRFRAIMEK